MMLFDVVGAFQWQARSLPAAETKAEAIALVEG